MMSQRNTLLLPSKQDEEITQNSTTRSKPTSSTRSSHHPDPQQQQQQQQEALKCPRCDSTNTKFCYYNNYSLTQPRHFCKTCRRYWTKGGALRNVPIGGGCRKTKKLKSSTSKLSSSAADNSPFFNAAVSPSFNNYHSFVGLNYYNNNNNSSSLAPLIQDHTTNSLASSIESLSSLNQDLHWKLQQQRLGMLFASDDQHKDQTQKLLQPILFHNLEVPRQESCSKTTGDATTEWFFGGTGTGAGAGWNNNNGGSVHAAAWEDLHHFTALP